MFTKTIAGVECNVDVNSLPAESVAFLLNYGIGQYLQDGAAVSLKDEAGNKRTDLDTIAAEKKAGVEQRLENILKGEFKRSGGTRVTDPVAKVKRDMALEYLRPAYKNAGKELPKGQELAAKVNAFWASEKNQKALGKELEKRINALSTKVEGIEIEID